MNFTGATKNVAAKLLTNTAIENSGNVSSWPIGFELAPNESFSVCSTPFSPARPIPRYWTPSRVKAAAQVSIPSKVVFGIPDFAIAASSSALFEAGTLSTIGGRPFE